MSANPVSTVHKESFSIKALMACNPTMAYFLIAFAGTWLLDSPMVLGKDGLGIFAFNVPLPIYVILFILGSYAGPTLAALLVTNALEGWTGVKAFFRRYIQWRVRARWYLVVLFGYPVVYVAAAIIWIGVAPLQNIIAQWTVFFTTYLPAILIFPGLITWGEEPGWRGFAQTRLQERYGALKASLVVGFLHGIWHLPIFLIVNGPVMSGPFNLVQFAQNTMTIMIITLIWTWVFNNTEQSILISVLLHASGNAVVPLMSTWIPNFPQQAQYTVLAFYVVIALAVVMLTRGQLSYKPVDSQTRNKS